MKVVPIDDCFFYDKQIRKVKNKERKKKLLKQSKRQRLTKVKNLIIQLKEKGCLFCGSKKDLTFHHVDHKSKKNNVPHVRFLWKTHEEAKKCWILCDNCHRGLHATENGVKRLVTWNKKKPLYLNTPLPSTTMKFSCIPTYQM